MSDVDSTDNQISQITSSSKQNSDSTAKTNGNNDVSSSMSDGVPSSFSTNQNAFTSPRTTVNEQQPKPPILAPSKLGGVGATHTQSSSVLAPSRLFGSASSSASSSNQFGLGKSPNCTSSSTPFNSSKFTLKPSVLGASSSASTNPFLKAPAKDFDLDDSISKSSDSFKKKEEQDNASGSLFEPSKEKISSSTANGDNENGKTSEEAGPSSAETHVSEESKSCEAASSSSPNNGVCSSESTAAKTDSEFQSSKAVESNGATGFSFCSSSTSSNLTKPLQSNFVFGQNLLSRVADSEGISSSTAADKEGEAKKKEEEGGLFSAAASLFSAAANAISTDTASSSNGKSLETSSRELAEKESREKRKFDEVEVITGEETESNVLQMNCRVYMWLKGGWVERGRGILRLNDWGCGGVEMNSRLVIRTQGTLTIMLNTKIWHEMNVEKASGKGVRFTAVDPDGQLKVYLVMGSAKEIEMLFTSLEWRVANIRRREKTDVSSTKKAKQEE